MKQKKKTVDVVISEGFRSFMESVKAGPDFPYYILVVIYIAAEYAERIKWSATIFPDNRINFIDYFVLFGSGAYLCYKAAMCKKLREKPLLLLPVILAVGLLCCGFLLYLVQEWNLRKVAYTVVIDIILCLMAYGKNKKKLFQWIVFIPVGALLVAALGLPIGLTQDYSKIGAEGATRSFGMIYPNTWGYIAFQAMLMVWYLYLNKELQAKHIIHWVLTFVLFWGMFPVLLFVVGCRTVAGLVLIFPLMALLAAWMKKRGRKSEKKPGVLGWLVILLPILCYVFSLALSMEKEWVAVTFYPMRIFGVSLRSMAMRFVQSGLALEYFGFPMFGRAMRVTDHVFLDPATGYNEYLYVMDNAYMTYTITKGVLWICGLLAWMTYGQWKGWKNKDHGILLVGSFMMLFSVMECPGLEVWFNFVLLYPLLASCDTEGLKEPLIIKGTRQEREVKRNESGHYQVRRPGGQKADREQRPDRAV